MLSLLPPELLELILCWLNYRDIVIFGGTCQDLHILVRNISFWQKLLFLRGVRANGSKSLLGLHRRYQSLPEYDGHRLIVLSNHNIIELGQVADVIDFFWMKSSWERGRLFRVSVLTTSMLRTYKNTGQMNGDCLPFRPDHLNFSSSGVEVVSAKNRRWTCRRKTYLPFYQRADHPDDFLYFARNGLRVELVTFRVVAPKDTTIVRTVATNSHFYFLVIRNGRREVRRLSTKGIYKESMTNDRSLIIPDEVIMIAIDDIMAVKNRIAYIIGSSVIIRHEQSNVPDIFLDEINHFVLGKDDYLYSHGGCFYNKNGLVFSVTVSNMVKLHPYSYHSAFLLLLRN